VLWEEAVVPAAGAAEDLLVAAEAAAAEVEAPLADFEVGGLPAAAAVEDHPREDSAEDLLVAEI